MGVGVCLIGCTLRDPLSYSDSFLLKILVGTLIAFCGPGGKCLCSGGKGCALIPGGGCTLFALAGIILGKGVLKTLCSEFCLDEASGLTSSTFLFDVTPGITGLLQFGSM